MMEDELIKLRSYPTYTWVMFFLFYGLLLTAAITALTCESPIWWLFVGLAAVVGEAHLYIRRDRQRSDDTST